MKRKISIGQAFSLAGTALLSAGLILNGLEVLSNTAFRAVVFTGIVIELIALILILKRKEF